MLRAQALGVGVGKRVVGVESDSGTDDDGGIERVLTSSRPTHLHGPRTKEHEWKLRRGEQLGRRLHWASESKLGMSK